MLKNITTNSTLSIIAPAFPPVPEKTEMGIVYLEEQGFNIIRGASLTGNYGYFSASDEQRIREINEAFTDPGVDAVICARGGWGALRLLDKLDYRAIKANPKMLVGYSDITFLQLAIWKQCAVPSFSGPMVAVEMGSGILDFTEKYFWEQIFNKNSFYPISIKETGGEIWKNGSANGTLLGGCLSMMAHLLGTPYSPDYTNAILFFEDVGEEPYKIDRYLAQLKQAAVFKKIRGLIIGEFIDCLDDREPSFSIEEILHHYVDDLDIPVIYNFPYGHGMRKVTMPVGVQAEIDTLAASIKFGNPFI